MSYIVFARKYRPQSFEDMIGQSHITTTLKNAISKGRTAHAYLFAGPRGVGKTTTARILARALNCENGPTPSPCGKCASCLEIAKSSSLDTIEIDGASNRGIDEIRTLRESVKFAPSKGRFKVYIIDEVHMLTEPAFNALLKTLEEPPPHVKFIFATTQGYKVPATILSRCQRFDFRRLSSKDISASLRRIAEAEGIGINDEALGVIAKYSDGSMREAQVLLDQISSFAFENITRDEVVKILGIVGDEAVFQLSGAIRAKDPALALKLVDALINDGKDIMQVISALIEHFRNMAIVKIGRRLDSLIDAGPDRISRYETESASFSTEEIVYIIYVLLNTMDFSRKSGIPRIPLEAALVKLTQPLSVISLPEIMSRLNAFDQSGRADVSPAVDSLKMRESHKSDLSYKAPSSVQPVAPLFSPGSSQKSMPPQLNEVLAVWATVINYIKARKISIASYLQEGYPVNADSGRLSIGFSREFQFHKEVLDSQDNRRLIEDALKNALGRDVRISLVTVEPMAAKKDGNNTCFNDESVEDAPAPADNESDPILKSALEIFGGEVAQRSRPKRAEGGR